jgi:hypothetical protein
MLGNSWVTERRAPSLEGLSSVSVSQCIHVWTSVSNNYLGRDYSSI